MKTKSIFKVLSILLLTFLSNVIIGQTTVEEYNYIKKGYQVQIESGLDMKKGYELEDVQTVTATPRTATLKKLVKIVNGQKKIAAYMVIYVREGSPKEYICVPNPKSEKEVLDAFWKTLYDNGFADQSARLQIICYLLTQTLNW